MSIFPINRVAYMQHAQNQQVAALGTGNLHCGLPGIQAATLNMVTPIPLTVNIFSINTFGANQPGDGDATIDLYVNNLFVLRLITIPPGTVAGVNFNTSVGYLVDANQSFRFVITNNSPTLPSIAFTAWSFAVS